MTDEPRTSRTSGWFGHLDRLGGILVRPRATLRRLIETNEGRLGEVIVWLVVLTAASTPVRTGRAILIGRSNIFDGLMAFLQQMQVRLVVPLLGIVIAAMLLAALGRDRGLTFDRALDVVTFTLVPVCLLMAVGIVLRAADINVGFLPHRSWRGPWTAQVTYLLVSYGWSFALLGLAALEARRTPVKPPPPTPS